MTSCGQVFESIYRSGGWRGPNGQPAGGGSGDGSNPWSTVHLRGLLRDFLTSNGLTRLVDVGCGSCEWVALLLNELHGAGGSCASSSSSPAFTYVGLDASSTALDAARVRLASLLPSAVHRGVELGVRDASCSGWRSPSCDVLICRDVLQHLPLSQACTLVSNLLASPARWVVLGTYTRRDGSENCEVPPGGYYSVDLCAPPFSALFSASGALTFVLPERSGSPEKHLLFVQLRP